MNILHLKQSLKKMTAYALSIIAFPLNCISCGSPSYGVALCKTCITDFLENIEPWENRCKHCGVLRISEVETCLECREEVRVNHVSSIFPIHPYVLWKKELLFAWKIANGRCFTPLFAQLVHNVLATYYKDLIIVPIPPRKGKIKKKGWDQIDDLCNTLENKYHHTVRILLERISGDEQKKLSKEERLEKSGKNYSVKTGIKDIPKEVVLIDDVMTTGATLENCASALLAAGIEKVHAVTIFYVP